MSNEWGLLFRIEMNNYIGISNYRMAVLLPSYPVRAFPDTFHSEIELASG